MKRILIILIAVWLSVALALTGCRIARNRDPVEKDGKQYGVTSGAFRHRYWNHYERGLSYAEGGFWKEAEEDFRAALLKRDVDRFRSRIYGLHFIEYFPRRELGIVLFHQGRFPEAIRELESSLGREISSKAQFYLDKARKAWIESGGKDMAIPEIACRLPAGHGVVNRNKVMVSGVVKDDTFVKEIKINGRAVQVDLSAPEIFFKAEVPLGQGDNRISIEARDLAGKTARLERTVRCDRLGPVLSIDESPASEAGDHSRVIRLYVGDDDRLGSVTVNGRQITCHSVSGDVFECPVSLGAGESKAVISAEDRAGNRTTAEFFLDGFQAGALPELLLASLDMPPYSLSDISSKGTGGSWPAVGREGPPVESRFPLQGDRGGATGPREFRPDLAQGNNHALIIGINAYEHWGSLKTAVNDARALKKILVERYAFQEENIRFLTDKDATRMALIDALMEMTSGLGESDNLLVYFAGHGQLSEHANDGYWIPVEGKRGSAVWSWIAHSAVKNIIVSEEVRAKNIVVIADSCYGGKLARGGAIAGGDSSQKDLASKLLQLSSRKSRQIITSGSLEPVADWGKDNHSLFAYYLLKGLEENMQPAMDLKSLVNAHVWDPVFKISGQRPVVGRFKTPMDEDGEFVLFLKEGGGVSVASREETAPPLDQRGEQRGADTSSPIISIKNWQDSQTVFLDHVFLEGRVTDESGVEEVSINGRRVLKWPGRTIYFQHMAELREGDNPFVIECVDKGGNRARQEIHIYRKVRKVYESIARMSVALFPLEIMGALGLDLDSTLFDSFFDCDRFNLKQWQGNLPAETRYDIADFSRLAKEQGADFFITGKATARGGALEIRLHVVETETLDIVAAADVYDEGIDREGLGTMCRGLLFKIRQTLPLVEGKVAMIKGKKVIVNLGENKGVRKGMHLIVYEEDEAILDPETGELLGRDARLVGTARISKVLARMSHAELMGGPEVNGGLRVGHPVITK